ncbi:retention module-containing protein, partial [Orrella sp. 11846]|uniref:retention module-containing protein n=1 Tax=Orrella sp. 11846 TaxID=3409913 RepID=UPI003B5B573D
MANASVVTQVKGQAWIRDEQGSLTVLREGMEVPINAVVVTAEGASVQLQPEGSELLAFGGGREVRFSPEVLQPNVDATTEAVAPLTDTEADSVLSALLDGRDPFADLEPTAAVNATAGGADGGGSGFVRVVSIIETTIPMGLEYPRPLLPRPEEIRLGGYEGAGADAVDALPPSLVITDFNGVSAGHLSIREDATAPVGGSFAVSTPGGLKTLVVNGQSVTETELLETQSGGSITILTGKGELTITGFDPNTGSVTYEYIVDGPQDHSAGKDSVHDDVTVVVVDQQDQTAEGVLGVQILDTEPLAEDDSATIEEGATDPITGNVLDNDQPGADEYIIEFADTAAQYGELTVNPDGSWSYKLNNELETVKALNAGDKLTETFEYTITDADGDTSTATLTITVNGVNDAPVFEEVDRPGPETPVDPEDSVAPGAPTTAAGYAFVTESDLESEGAESTFTGTISVVDPDNTNEELTLSLFKPADDEITSNGAPVVWDLSEDGQTLVGTAGGEDVITVTIGNDGQYSVTLQGPVDHADGDGQNLLGLNVGVTVTDPHGATSNSVIHVTVQDSVPVAESDEQTVNHLESVVVDAENGVLKNDSAGADQWAASGAVVGVVAGDDQGTHTDSPAGTVGSVITGKYGNLILNADGSYQYESTVKDAPLGAADTFVYTVKDSDGDLASSTLTVEVKNIEVTLTLSDIEAKEGETGTITGTLSHAAGTDFTVTLSNGSTLSFVAGATEATTAPFEVQSDDVFVDADTYEVTVTDAGAHNFENLNASDKSVVKVADTTDTVFVDVTVDNAAPEEGETVTYTVTLRNDDGLPVVDHGGLTITLSNGEVITLDAGATSGSVAHVVTDSDDLYVGDWSETVSVDNIFEVATAESGQKFEDIQAGNSITIEVTDLPGTTPIGPGVN